MFIVSAHGAAFQHEASVLMEHHANPTLRDNYGRTPLFIAAEQGKSELMKFLLEKDVSSASIPNLQLWTPLHIAAFGVQTAPRWPQNVSGSCNPGWVIAIGIGWSH